MYNQYGGYSAQNSIPNAQSYVPPTGTNYNYQNPPQSYSNVPVFNNFLNDPRANLGIQVGQSAIAQGTQMMESNLKPYLGTTSDLKRLFKVSNQYVVKKIGLIVFPFRHSSWSRLILSSSSGRAESFEVPCNDINSPDLYIPLMAFITYILLCAISQGLKGEFHPQTFGYTSSMVFGFQMLDMLVLKLGLYLMNVDSQIWDLICYSSYKFIPLVACVVLDTFVSLRSVGYWLVVGYLSFAFEFFLMRSLKNVFLGNGLNSGTHTVTQKQRQKRIYLLFGYTFPFQMILMWLLI